MARTCVIAEADPFIARLLERFAEESRLESVRARVGQEILDLARCLQPQVIIVDAELPGEMRGWEAVRELRAHHETCDIAVVSCSWLSKDDAVGLIGPIAGHLQKPDLHYSDFVTALNTAGVSMGQRLESSEASGQ